MSNDSNSKNNSQIVFALFSLPFNAFSLLCQKSCLRFMCNIMFFIQNFYKLEILESVMEIKQYLSWVSMLNKRKENSNPDQNLVSIQILVRNSDKFKNIFKLRYSN